MTRYAKAFVAVVGALLAALAAALSDDHMSSAEWVGVAVAAVTALGVFLVPNTPQTPDGS